MTARHRVSPAMVVACLALVVALGGTSYAVTQLPANSVGRKQLKKDAVVSSKVKDNSLLARDFKSGQLPRGAPGLPGTARAYAHVRSDGTIDRVNSKNVIDVRPQCSGPCSPPPAAGPGAVQCFKLDFTPVNAVASIDWGDSVFASVVEVQIPGAVTPTLDFEYGCPAGYRAAETATLKTSDDSPTKAGFYIVFN